MVVTLSTQDNAKLLPQLKSDFKRTMNWNKYQSKVTKQVRNPYLDYLTGPRFQGVNKLFVLSLENTTDRTVYTKYYLPTVEIKDYNVVIDRQNIFNQPVKSNLRTYDKIQKMQLVKEMIILLNFLINYFNKYYKMIAIDLSKQQALDADQKAIQQTVLQEI